MKGTQVVALIVVLIVIAGVVVAKSRRGEQPSGPPVPVESVAAPDAAPPAETEAADTAPADETDTAAEASADTGEQLPKLLELGSVGCKPCEYMAPIIDSLEKELAGKVFVKFYDVNENSAIAEQYQIMTIPTQIFLDAEGKELFRHIGVFEKEEILAKLKELGMLKE
ncbi:MAG: thioredoxin family protein [Armatimonadetes bacterium]|nr:thioredoxin family protein [Armatimonadota bacterium]